MTDAQAAREADADRREWARESTQPARAEIAGRWYAANTREPIRDETLRAGLVRVGAVREREGLPTTSPLGRYALTTDFAALFDPALQGDALREAIERWQEASLTAGALARIAILRRGAAASRRARIRNLSERRNADHGAGAELPDLEGGGRGIRAAFSRNPKRRLAE